MAFAPGAPSFRDLPDECILQALSHLSVPDVLAFRKTCRRFNWLLQEQQFWLPRLRDDFGLHLEARRPRSRAPWR
jgi:hypothetical protein